MAPDQYGASHPGNKRVFSSDFPPENQTHIDWFPKTFHNSSHTNLSPIYNTNQSFRPFFIQNSFPINKPLTTVGNGSIYLPAQSVQCSSPAPIIAPQCSASYPAGDLAIVGNGIKSQLPTAPVKNIIDFRYCASNDVNLTIVREIINITNSNFVVKDDKDTVIFKVNGKLASVHGRVEILDGAGKPVVTLRPKFMSVHGRWEVFRGKSTETRDLLFSVKRSEIIQTKSELHVFLAENTKEDVCDFKVEASWLEKSCVVYGGESSPMIGQMRKKGNMIGKDTFSMTICPNNDSAFIVVLVVILDVTKSITSHLYKAAKKSVLKNVVNCF